MQNSGSLKEAFDFNSAETEMVLGTLLKLYIVLCSDQNYRSSFVF